MPLFTTEALPVLDGMFLKCRTFENETTYSVLELYVSKIKAARMRT